MRIYAFAFQGVWLGGRALVVAESEEAARELLLKTHGVDKLGKLRFDGSYSGATSEIVYFDNGDY